METKKLILICATIIICVAIIAGVFVFSNKTSTTIIEDKDSTFTIGNKYSVCLIDANGVVEYFDVSTNDKGIAKQKIDLSAGNYSVNASFGGDDKFGPSSVTQSIKVKKKAKKKETSSSVATSGTTITPSYEYEKYDGEYKLFTDERDGEIFTDVLQWDSNAGCYHW